MREVSLVKEMHAAGLTDMKFLYLGEDSCFRLCSFWILINGVLRVQGSMSILV